MTGSTNERLYRLLPAVYRMRDAEAGEPLKALLAVMEGQLDTLRDDIAGLYDNWFIETCDEWVVPYIGDLLSVRGQYTFNNDSMSLRPFVANTLGYRRRKGAASMLEGLATDVTGWRAFTVEFFQLLATTQHLNHIRTADLRTPDLRDTDALELLGGPFERTMHFADVRRVSTSSGKYNIGNVGVFLWRLFAIPVDRAPAIPATAVGPGRFWFDQLGVDSQLFNPRHRDTPVRASEADVPGPLRPRALYTELVAARAVVASSGTPTYRYFNRGNLSAFTVYVNGVALEPHQIQICDLSNWAVLPVAEPGAKVSVDPVLGRLVHLGAVPEMTHVSYQFGFSAEIGGGEYARKHPAPPAAWTTYPVEVLDPTAASDDGFVQALDEWEADGRPNAVFEFRGPEMFDFEGSGIFRVRDFTVPAGRQVSLRAAEYSRPLLRPTAPWTITLDREAGATLDGLLIAGAPLVITTALPPGPPAPSDELGHSATIVDCTLVPAGKAVALATGAASRGQLTLTITRSIVGRIDATDGDVDFAPSLVIADSIVDGDLATSEDLTIERTTVLGSTAVKTLEASEVIFDDRVVAMRTQIGCVRFSYVPAMSTVPRQYRCQPALALEAAEDDVAAANIRDRVRPVYTSRHYKDPGYLQLATTCAVEIATGAEAGREMGAFHHLMQPQRLANLRISLDEYLRFGLEAGCFLVT